MIHRTQKKKHTKVVEKEQIRVSIAYKDRYGRTWLTQYDNMVASEDGKVLRHVDDIKWG